MATLSESRVPAEVLARFLNPQSIAVLGASEASRRFALPALLRSGIEVHFVNPRTPTVHGHPTVPDLESIGSRVDAVYSLVNARLSTEIIEHSGELVTAGVVVQAAGFAEAGADGARLQERLRSAVERHGIAVLGPNCNGFVNGHTGAFLSGVPRVTWSSGGLGVITHSGAVVTDLFHAAHARNIGLSSVISTGNEAVTDVVDYIDYLVADEATRVIGLVLESIRRPAAFFEAAERARAAGRPVIALRLGRSRRAREIARSHTGSIIGESWVYDAAFKQHGILLARDLNDLMDRALLFEQLAPEHWTAVSGLAAMTISGGAAALVSDIADAEGVALPTLESVAPQINAVLPNARTMNPIDFTGFVHGNKQAFTALVRAYGESPEVDTLLMVWMLDADNYSFSESVVEPYVELASEIEKPMVIAAVDDSGLDGWARELPSRGIAVARGLRGAIRGFAAMAEFARMQERGRAIAPDRRAWAPRDVAAVDSTAGPMLPFDEAMRLVRDLGVPVAPYAVIAPETSVARLDPGFAGPYVVKLADIPHRTEIRGVRIGIDTTELAATVDDLRGLAASGGLPQTVVVQPQVSSEAEAFLGLDCTGELGPVLVFGLGGIFVEVLGRVTGRLAPISHADALDMLAEFDDVGLMDGVRGRAAWDRTELARILEAVSALGASEWVASLDINPLLVGGPDGYTAVDALVLLRENVSRGDG
jgi:acyl-CoA synthetase (NDP forming)